ncbi:MAG: polysaccharide deacetylase family protein [Clostridia bacterium]|nr:polysaccharide deacetylase family protein [Clostridia bacterium]
MKTKIWTVSAHRVMSNLVIVVMLLAVSCVAMFGVNFVTSSTVINGVYYSGNEKSDKITLMINVYWGTEYLDDMLQTLKDNDVTTTFFVGGTWAVKEADMLQKIVDAGHEIGNHGYYHKDQGKLSADKNNEEIETTHKLVKSLVGVDMNLFAPPSGSYNKQTVEVAKSLGYKTIMWTEGKDTVDWRDKDSELIYTRATKNAKGGDFVLMHPTEATAKALDRIIKTLKQKGLKITTISENIGQN